MNKVPIQELRANAYTIATDGPESDGTFAWDSTTIVIVELEAGGRVGLGYSYTAASAAGLIDEMFRPHILGGNALDPAAVTARLQHEVRNIGRAGLAATAISAVDLALYDLKAKILDLPLVQLLGQVRPYVEVYGSGGFTSYDDQRLAHQLGAWVEEGCAAVKMKVGTNKDEDPHRVKVAREAIGTAHLFVDGNGAYDVSEALYYAEVFNNHQIGWFEEPVSSDDLEGLHAVRERVPPGIAVAAGEYGFTPSYFSRMLAAGAVHVLQADCTRCGGITGFMRAAALCEATNTDLSAHCAPAAHLHVACAVPRLRHQEWFHDHVRIEHMLFDGAPDLENGTIKPDDTRPGHGLVFKRQDAERLSI